MCIQWIISKNQADVRSIIGILKPKVFLKSKLRKAVKQCILATGNCTLLLCCRRRPRLLQRHLLSRRSPSNFSRLWRSSFSPGSGSKGLRPKSDETCHRLTALYTPCLFPGAERWRDRRLSVSRRDRRLHIEATAELAAGYEGSWNGNIARHEHWVGDVNVGVKSSTSEVD